MWSISVTETGGQEQNLVKYLNQQLRSLSLPNFAKHNNCSHSGYTYKYLGKFPTLEAERKLSYLFSKNHKLRVRIFNVFAYLGFHGTIDYLHVFNVFFQINQLACLRLKLNAEK